MDTGLTFRILFFILLGGMLVVRMYFNLRLRQSGEHFMPDHEAKLREGVGMFATRGCCTSS